jgi:hypothetical protein
MTLVFIGNSIIGLCQDSIISKPIYWEFEWDFCFLNNTPDGYKPDWNKSLGGRVDLKYNFKLGNKGLNFATGIGFSMFKIYSNMRFVLQENNTEIQIIPEGIEYYENNLNMNFINIPCVLRYSTIPNKRNLYFSFEGGMNFGFIVASKINYSVKNDKIITTTTIENNTNLKTFQYGIISKLAVRKFKIDNNRRAGLSLFISGEYSLSQIFKINEGPNLGYYNLGFGIGFIFQ